MRNFLIVIVVFGFMIMGCRKVVDSDELLNVEPQVFISSYISPQDTVFRVHVSRALPAVGTILTTDLTSNEEKFLIRNAIITITDERDNSTLLSYSEEDYAYLADASTLNIETGGRYYLKVEHDGKTYSASCKIPEKVQNLNESIEFVPAEYGGSEAEIKISFQDFSGQRNYYVLGGKVSTTFQYENEEPQTIEFSISFDSDEFLTDNLEDGGTLSGTSENYIDQFTEISETKIILQVAHVEEILFQNLKAVSTNSDAEDNPFVEYSIAPNNFEENGALGVFAGYQLTEKEFTVDSE